MKKRGWVCVPAPEIFTLIKKFTGGQTMLEKTYTKMNEMKAALDEEYTATINAKVADLKIGAEKEIRDRFNRDLDSLARFSILSEESALSGLSGTQAGKAVKDNNRYAAVTLALIDYFKQHPDSNGAEITDMGVMIPTNMNVEVIRYIARASCIMDKFEAARPRLSLGILAMGGKA
jgi:hypothetical protein